MSDPMTDPVVFTIGTIPVTAAVVHTWGIMIGLTVLSWLGTRRLAVRPGRWQTCLEMMVTGAADQIRAVIRRDPAPYLPLLATLFLFIAVANTLEQFPGLRSPTARIETAGAMAVIVYLMVHAYGIASQGLWGHLRHYAEPNPLFVPLHLMSELTRTGSMTVRLAGNITGHGLTIGIILGLAGFLVPVPLMALGLLIGLIQAYIFTMLATVFIAAVVDVSHPQCASGASPSQPMAAHQPKESSHG
jgi:F-type H+-transporting ATPase subunit a